MSKERKITILFGKIILQWLTLRILNVNVTVWEFIYATNNDVFDGCTMFTTLWNCK